MALACRPHSVLLSCSCLARGRLLLALLADIPSIPDVASTHVPRVLDIWQPVHATKMLLTPAGLLLAPPTRPSDSTQGVRGQPSPSEPAR